MLGRIVTRWHDIVGPELADKTQPVKLRYMKKKANAKGKATASLDIATPTADATLLHYQKDLILERINRIFGENWITAIRFVPMASNETETRPVKKKKKPLTEDKKHELSNMLDDIDDPEIQERLKRLGTAILQDE